MSHKGMDESSLGTSWSSEPFSSGLSSPFGSELGSTTETEESENEDFLAELTLQMANYMLQEDDDEEEEEEEKEASQSKPPSTDSVSDHSESEGNKLSACNSTSTYYCDNRFMRPSTEQTGTGVYYRQTFPDAKMQPMEVYELKNQPMVVKQESSSYFNPLSPKQGRAKHVHHHHQYNNKPLVKQQVRNNSLPAAIKGSVSGSGMRAVFLGGSGSSTRSTTSSGTGVFLPRLVDGNNNNNQQTQPVKRLAGCSTVLIPARVLQALESHFNKNVDALSQSNGCGAYTVFTPQGRPEQKKNSRQASNSEEMKLPEDWTY